MDAVVELLLRWIHFSAGIVWIGHNYSSVVQQPAFRPLTRADLVDGESVQFMSRLNREHGFFRYASIVTWLAGIGMLLQRGWLADALLLRGALVPIGIGVWIGTAMLLNLWLVLWPNQKKVLGFVPASVEQRIACARTTFLASRTNTMLSIPLLFFMAAGAHGGFLFG
jgi:uncharacterized membrane protein